MTLRFPGRQVDVRVTTDGAVELTLSDGDGRTPPTRAVLTPDHALWIAEQLRAAARLAAKA